jgi:NOL1/NOP2/sun family putative RNA methylase
MNATRSSRQSPEVPLPLRRYQEVIPDWAEFQEAVASPEAVTFRVRPGALDEEAIVQRLALQGFHLARVPGLRGYWRVNEGPGSVAQTPEHWLGLLHVQQAVMALPALALDPRPGETVLDLCAAPGGKTTHMAQLMEDRGPLVAVDPKEKRLRGLLGNIYRLGHSNVLVIAADGRTLPSPATFDRILVDAPCSAEGNIRRQGGRAVGRNAEFTEHISSVQEALLRKAVSISRPGGVIVYSTCTFAPEENEAVVSRVLADAGVGVEEIEIHGIPHAPGLGSWEEKTFDPELRKAWRVYPHHMDSGGLFMVRLRKLAPGKVRAVPADASDSGSDQASGMASGGVPTDDSESSAGSPGWSKPPVAFPGEDEALAARRLASARHALVHRFGLSEGDTSAMSWLVRGENVWMHTADRWPVDAWESDEAAGRWRVVSLGIRALQERPPGMETPSTQFLTRWGTRMAPERQVDLSLAELRKILSDHVLPAENHPTGPVALLWDGLVIGRGMIGAGGLRHEIPGESAKRLQVVLGLLESRGSEDG